MNILWLCILGLTVTSTTTVDTPSTQPGDMQRTLSNETTTAPAAVDHPFMNGNIDDLEDMGGIEDLELLEMEVPEVTVVTAARREQKISEVPYAISVITAEDIRWSGARSIPDALRLAAGVDVADLSSNAYAVSPRGLHGFLANQYLVLVDGRQIFDSIFGGTLWGSWPFMLEDIQRIEVIRGPGGVTWGANAVQGVINVITRDPQEQLGLTVKGGGGSRGWNKEYVGYGWAEDGLRLRFSGEYEAHDGYLPGDSLLIPKDTFFDHLDDEFKLGRSSLHVIRDLNERDTLTLSAGNAVVDDGYPGSPLRGLFNNKNAGSEATYILGKWDHQSDKHDFQLTGYFNEFGISPGARQLDYRYQQYALLFSHTCKPTNNSTYTWGIDNRIEQADSSNSDPYAFSRDYVTSGISAVYLQGEWKLDPQWTFRLGGRLDYDYYGGFNPSGRASLSYTIDRENMVYAAVSRAFHMTPAKMRFSRTPMLNGLAAVTADRDFDSQKLLAYELGYRGRPLDKLELSTVAFWHEYKDQISVLPCLGPPGLLRRNYQNVGNASMVGAELEAKYAATDKLTLLGNYSFQYLDWRHQSAFFHRENMTPPRNKFMLGARYSPTEDLHLSSHLYYVDSITAPSPDMPLLGSVIDAYFRWDVRAEYEFWKDNASLAVGVRNLQDDLHPEGKTLFLNDTEVPRLFYAEFRFRIQ